MRPAASYRAARRNAIIGDDHGHFKIARRFWRHMRLFKNKQGVVVHETLATQK